MIKEGLALEELSVSDAFAITLSLWLMQFNSVLLCVQTLKSPSNCMQPIKTCRLVSVY